MYYNYVYYLPRRRPHTEVATFPHGVARNILWRHLLTRSRSVRRALLDIADRQNIQGARQVQTTAILLVRSRELRLQSTDLVEQTSGTEKHLSKLASMIIMFI